MKSFSLLSLSLFLVGAVGCESPAEDSGQADAATAEGEPLTYSGALPAPPALPPKSASGFYSPINSTLSYDCKYGTKFTTLFLDNEDGGATASGTAGYTGSRCDSYDATSGKTYNGQYCGAHPGVDVPLASGTTLYATAAGTVTASYSSCTSTSGTSCGSGWGNYVIIKSTAYSTSSTGTQLWATSATGHTTAVTIYTLYAHLSTVTATSGAVTAGASIGTSGNTGNSTGAHLHFQIDRNFTVTGSYAHPFWPTMTGWTSANKPDYANSKSFTSYNYNPLYAIGFGTCG